MGDKKSVNSTNHSQVEMDNTFKKGKADDTVSPDDKVSENLSSETRINVDEDEESSKTEATELAGTTELLDLEIQDIEGIGPSTTKKLREAGILSVMDLAVAGVEDLAVDINSTKDSAASFIMAAQKLLRESNILGTFWTSSKTVGTPSQRAKKALGEISASLFTSASSKVI